MKKIKFEKSFGAYLCSDDVLARLMPKKDFAKYQNIKVLGGALDAGTAKSIAKAIKKWSLDHGATHYTHWFAPLNGKTAEKQVSFIEIDQNGKYIEDFNEKSLIKGETDASSFPNGGERMTFEARGYTVWDYTSPVFIKEDVAHNKVLYIPTAFCSYNGTALDEKTPLLRAIESLNTHALRVLKHMGYKDVKKVTFNVGAEQEYFLINSEHFEQRFDLKMTGRTLCGATPTKSQEGYSHYFGMIDDKISQFMNDVDRELWKMGITAKIQHNEAAPCQHELVPIFNSVNIASDQNQVIMEVISSTAKKHNLTALFHEKPFACINGSGKHINCSLSTDTGLNLLDSNLQDKNLFLVFFTSIIATIDNYYKLIRSSTAYRGNDLRLGGHEAPPALISVFIGEKFEKLLDSIDLDSKDELKDKILDTRVKSLPKTIKDFCDRNRTSPFAFSGNKFEFRMVGSSQSIAWPSTCLCTAISKTLKDIADKLDGEKEYSTTSILKILKENIANHKRIVFNGNGYDDEWKVEAKKRGLEECRDSISAYEVLDNKEVFEVFESMGVLNKSELSLRKTTLTKNYIDSVIVEGKTLVELILKTVYPNLNDYLVKIASSKSIYKSRDKDSREDLCEMIDSAMSKLYYLSQNLYKNISLIESFKEIDKKTQQICSLIIPNMDEIRRIYDEIEKVMPKNTTLLPSYNDILFKD